MSKVFGQTNNDKQEKGDISMQGKILDFSIQRSSGLIAGDDGKRYSFNSSEWNGQAIPVNGMLVDFETDALGNAVAIYTVNSSYTVNPTISAHPSTVLAKTTPTTSTSDTTTPASNRFRAAMAYLFAPPDDKTEEQYHPMDWYQKCIWNYVNFKGRARRKEFWFFTLAYSVIIMIGILLAGSDSFFVNMFALLLLLPTLAASARRLHDTGRSGWWTLISVLPLIGVVVLIYWWAQEGQTQANAYGAPVK
jgi:uncharacterized membrane protein YhaH (DUF805 family)